MITGHSGAGKSEAIAAFEDGGYFCVDNLPPRMIEALGELFRHEGSGVERAAVVSDVRGRRLLRGPACGDRGARGRRPRPQAALPRGRRGDPSAPLQGDPPATPARPERPDRRRDPRGARSSWLRCASAPTWSSTPPGSPAAALRRRIATELIGRETEENQLALTLLTFGFKNGPPSDADLTLDVRFLPNPHYDDELRPLTGRDQAVKEYVESGTQAGEFYGRLMPLLEFLLPAYVAEGKQHLTIAVGCTGGRHRSITVADRDRSRARRPRRRRAARRPPRRRARLAAARPPYSGAKAMP